MNKLSAKIMMQSFFIIIKGSLLTLVVSAIFSILWAIAYAIFFSWWAYWVHEYLGIAIYWGVLAIFMLMMFYVFVVLSIRDKKYTLVQQHEVAKFSYKTDTSRQERMLANHPKKSHELMVQVANEVSEERGLEQVLQAISKNRSPFPVTPKRIYVTNEERLKIAENTVEKMNEYSPVSLALQMFGIKEDLNTTVYGMPLTTLFEQFSTVEEQTRKVQQYKNDLHLQYQLLNEAEAYVQKEAGIIGAGVHGEERTNEELNMYEGLWQNFSNVRFEVDGQSVESDNIVVSTKGIFIVEVKNYSPNGNYGVRIAKDGQWLKVFNNGFEEPMNNVTMQMNRHIAFKHKLISEQYHKKYGEFAPITLLPIFVIANDTIRLQNETDLPIIRISQMYHHIMSQPDVLTSEQVERISKIIQENQLPPKTYEMFDYLPALDSAFNSIKEQEARLNKLFPILNEFSNKASTLLIDYEKTLPQKFK